MNLDQILAAINNLSPDEREHLKAYLSEHELSHQHRSVEAWLAEFQEIATEFRGDSSDDEMRQIVEAITLKSRPSEKGL